MWQPFLSYLPPPFKNRKIYIFFKFQDKKKSNFMTASPLNPVWYDPSVMNIWYGGGQKHLRYIILLYISQFKSDYSGVKSKSEVHIIRSHLEKKKLQKLSKMDELSLFLSAIRKFQKNWRKKFFGLKIVLTRSIFKILRSSFLQTSPICQYKRILIKNLGVIGGQGVT